MAFADAIAAAFADLLAENGRTITYAGRNITALVSIGEAPRRGAVHKSMADQGVIQVLKTDVVAPAFRDLVVIDGVTWRVDRIVRSNSTRSVLAIQSKERTGV